MLQCQGAKEKGKLRIEGKDYVARTSVSQQRFFTNTTGFLLPLLKMHTDNKKRWENGEGWYNVCDMFWLGHLMCKLDTSVRSI